MTTLDGFQRDFVHALGRGMETFAASRHVAFDVYRNTILRGCIDALEANYPAVVCLVGRDWFRAAAAIHVDAEPPRDARLIAYGEGFAAFLGDFEPAASLPYLADVARLDRLWTESFMAADKAAVDAPAWMRLDASSLATLSPVPHPGLRVFRAPLPAVSIWRASREGRAVSGELSWRAECALVSRPGLTVEVHDASAAALALIEACTAGATLADAAMHTLGLHPEAAIDHILAECLRIGAFAVPDGD